MGLKPMLIFVMEEGGGHPSQGLPGLGLPVDPGYGHPGFAPGHPSQGLPGQQPHPDQSLPGGGRPVDPGYGRPGMGAGRPDQSLPPIPVLPEQGLPDPGTGQPKPSVPANLPALPEGAFIVVWAPGYGYLAVPVSKPGQGGQPGQPPTAQPKR